MSGSNLSAPDAVPTEPLANAAAQTQARALSQPLDMTVHSLPSPGLEEEARRTATGRLKMLLILAICAAPVIASYLMYFVVRPQARSNYAELIQPSRTMPAGLPLRTLDGQSVESRSLRGQWLLIVVGGGRCDEACEKRLYFQRQLVEMTGREKGRIDKLWLIDDDLPVRPATLEALSAGQAVRVMRVPREQLAQWLVPAEGAALSQHLYVVDPMGEWMMRAPLDPDPAKLKRDIERLLRASAFWDHEGR